jgi:hypothetical protein
MGFLSEFTSYKYADFAQKDLEVGIPKTAATTQDDSAKILKRISRNELENLYLTDPQTFNTINTYKQLLLQAGYSINAINKTVQKQYDAFFEQIGKVGLHIKLEQLLDRIIQDVCLYGYAYIERVFNVEGNMIVDLKPVDAKLMDYARDMENRILVDVEQNPKGFTMRVGTSSGAKSDPLPPRIQLNSDQIYLKRERIACFTLFPYGNGFESMGIVEPAYVSIIRKLKIETAAANSIHNSAAYPVYAIVGDQQKSASKQLMQSTLGALQNLSSNRFMVFSHPTQIGTLNVEHSPQVEEMLRYLRTEQSAASGLALGFTVGSGETINRSTLNTQKEMLDIRMDALSSSLAEQFTSKILDPLYEMNGYGSKAVMKWNNVSTEDKLDTSKMLYDALDRKALTPREVRNYLKNILDVELDDKEFNKMLKEAEIERKEMINSSKQPSEEEDKDEEDTKEDMSKEEE